ncbi:hybrid sensor histidine kinase/response regulator [Leptolyngbya sp. NK1-12]|uniref:histidine kinase n=1 Tax=Leptolyngbya sp. NK1-12 TaxID=2547451 RepID=A0AA96WLR8_9CYAN|nr:hybrid sensor histidine kinase/response regulator [Leptolyngbya sp. NK1-12]WNZ27400.1 hybrid sensor histidine kinase/response regulator [Leptolyngbya sp. NK1-12]
MAQTRAEFSRARIVVVDDTPENLHVLSSMLTERGYDVRGVTSGLFALQAVKAAPPDLILLDIHMPDMDGYDVCMALKADPQTYRIPVVFISALNEVIDKVKAFSVGGVDYITKPFHLEEVLVRVENQLSLLNMRRQLEQQNAQLQQEIQERKRAEATLKEMLELREDLSRMIVHDLRNPLTTILLYSDFLLRRGELQDRARQSAEVIQSTAQQLEAMINDLLVMAKMESGKLILNCTEVDLNYLVMEVVEHLRAIADQKQIQLVAQLPDQKQSVSIDANLFRRVLDNLISNAIKFSPANRSVIVEVAYPTIVATNSRCKQAKISVIDQGLGITEDLQQQIFEKFTIGDLVKGVPQLGLGLAFCKMVVEVHGGSICIEPNQPQGSIFILEV